MARQKSLKNNTFYTSLNNFSFVVEVVVAAVVMTAGKPQFNYRTETKMLVEYFLFLRVFQKTGLYQQTARI